MELNLATGKLPVELYLKHSNAHQIKISEIEGDLEKMEKDTSNLSNYITKTLEFDGNLLKMWQNHDWNGKVRLQKLVLPEGLSYLPENDTLRTSKVNPIFSAITTISQHLSTEGEVMQVTKTNELHQVYLTFASSNFFWENLEKTALTLSDLAEFHLYKAPCFPEDAVSVSGSTVAYPYVSSDTGSRQDGVGSLGSILIPQNHYSGSTMQSVF